MTEIQAEQAPKRIADLAREATELGWRARLSYAEGTLSTRTGDRDVNSVCLRLTRPGDACFATWDVTTGCRFFAAVDTTRLRRLNVATFVELMRSER